MNNRKKYYSTFGVGKKQNAKKDLKDEKLFNLYQLPKKDKGLNQPHITNFKPWHTQQADILFMPEDDGYKYALVVVDIHTRICDAEPLKSKSADVVKKAFETIYKRKIMKKMPEVMRTDSGSEFKGEVAQYFKSNGVVLSYALPARHRQVAMVEHRNGVIAEALFKRMNAQELLTGEESVEWVEDLPVIIKEMNKHAEPQEKFKNVKGQGPLAEKDSVNMLNVGDKVRVALDYPISVATRKKIGDKFRKTDIRFNPKVQTITRIILKPNSPVLYMVDNNKRVAYTKNQLQVVPENEKDPMGEVVIRGKPKSYIPEKILGEKKIKGKLYYLVKWRGFKDPEYTIASDFKTDQPALVDKYEKNKD